MDLLELSEGDGRHHRGPGQPQGDELRRGVGVRGPAGPGVRWTVVEDVPGEDG